MQHRLGGGTSVERGADLGGRIGQPAVVVDQRGQQTLTGSLLGEGVDLVEQQRVGGISLPSWLLVSGISRARQRVGCMPRVARSP